MRWLALLVLFGCSKEPPPPAPTPSPPAAPPADAAPPGLRTQVFAEGIGTDQLPLTISVETLGGIASPVLARGTTLPAHFSDVFSTMADDQVSVEVHVTAGERPLAADNISLGKFQIVGIPPAPRAVPQIDVELEIDERGLLTATATDRATNTSRTMRITGTPSAPLDRAAIDAALASATAHHAADVVSSTRIHAHIDLEQLRIATQRTLEEAGGKLSADLRARIVKALASAARVNADWAKGDTKAIIAETEKLRAVAHEMSTTLYGATR